MRLDAGDPARRQDHDSLLPPGPPSDREGGPEDRRRRGRGFQRYEWQLLRTPSAFRGAPQQRPFQRQRGGPGPVHGAARLSARGFPMTGSPMPDPFAGSGWTTDPPRPLSPVPAIMGGQLRGRRVLIG